MKAALVSLLSDALDVPVFYNWQPDVTDECVFLGRALLDPTDRDEIPISFTFYTAELNGPRAEEYTVPISAWSFRGDLSPDEADDADSRCLEIVDDVLGVLHDIDLGVGSNVNARFAGLTLRRVPFDRGWACFAVVDLFVTASLN